MANDLDQEMRAVTDAKEPKQERGKWEIIRTATRPTESAP